MKMIIAEKYYYVHRVEQILPIVMGTKRRTGGQRTARSLLSLEGKRVQFRVK